MSNLICILLGLIAGTLSGIFGIGGGIIIIPGLIFLLGLTQHQAQGTTLAIMIPPIGLLAAWRYWQAGNVKIALAGFVCIGFFIGGSSLIEKSRTILWTISLSKGICMVLAALTHAQNLVQSGPSAAADAAYTTAQTQYQAHVAAMTAKETPSALAQWRRWRTTA